MPRPVIVRSMFGMGGSATDPGQHTFTEMVKAIDPERIDIGNSPYRDYQVEEISRDLKRAPENAIRIVFGSSLGANNGPVVAAYAKPATIHGVWGFQASSYGVAQPISSNVLFAHEVYSVWWLTGGLGTLQWTKAPGNKVTNLILTKQFALHPGETTWAMQTFLAEIKRVIAKPGDGLN